MRRLYLLIMLSTLIFVNPALARAGLRPSRQAAATPSIFLSSPGGGQALQGVIEIQGSTMVANFQSASLAFAYHADTTGTWFLIHESNKQVTDGLLAQWDTTTITDGNYDLQLVVNLKDGSQLTASVTGLRVRNYSAVETETPAPPTPSPTSSSIESLPTMTPTFTPNPPTITPLPTNPADLSQDVLLDTMGKGGLAALAFFILLGSYITVRGMRRRPRKH